jgi:hypothetical protein
LTATGTITANSTSAAYAIYAPNGGITANALYSQTVVASGTYIQANTYVIAMAHVQGGNAQMDTSAIGGTGAWFGYFGQNSSGNFDGYYAQSTGDLLVEAAPTRTVNIGTSTTTNGITIGDAQVQVNNLFGNTNYARNTTAGGAGICTISSLNHVISMEKVGAISPTTCSGFPNGSFDGQHLVIINNGGALLTITATNLVAGVVTIANLQSRTFCWNSGGSKWL